MLFRWATHGAPCEGNSHPQSSGPDHEFVVVHNGIVNNFAALKEFLVRLGVSGSGVRFSHTLVKVDRCGCVLGRGGGGGCFEGRSRGNGGGERKGGGGGADRIGPPLCPHFVRENVAYVLVGRSFVA